MSDQTRIDKYLWAIRVFKTRAEATQACNGGKVQIGGVNAKPGKAVRPGDLICVRKGAVQFRYKVLALADKRMGASLVPEYAENQTPEEEIARLRAPVETFFVTREHGAGRPTKKERRSLDALWDSLEEGD